MSFFIGIVLLGSLFVSFLKLALLPRMFALILAGLTIPAALLFNSTIAGTGKEQLINDFAGIEALRNWCALVVIQELIVCVAGASYLKSLAGGTKTPIWSYLTFCPSLLLPVGIWYLKLQGFNFLLEWSFTQVCFALAVMLPVIGFAIPELTRRIFRQQEELIEVLTRFEFFYVLLGIFLPVAAEARFQQLVPGGENIGDGLWLILGLGLVVLFIAFVINIYNTRKNRHEFYRTNS